MAPPMFPFFKLPAVAREAAIQDWDVDQVIESTMLSDIFREQLENYRYSCEKLTWFLFKNPSMEITNKKTTVSIRFKNMDDQTYTPVRKINGTYHFFNKEPKKTDMIGENFVQWYFHVDEDTFECKMRMLEEITKFLMNILKDASLNLECGLRDSNLTVKDLFIWKFTKSFTYFNIHDHSPGPNISPEDLVFLLEDIKAETRSMNIEVADFEYDKPIQGKDIHINNTGWVTAECLKGPEVVQITISSESFNYNEIIRHWVSGGSPNLESIQFNYHGSEPDPLQVFDGLNKKPTVFTEEDLDYRGSCSLPEDGHDIRRKGDGRLCTIVTEGDYMLAMLIWHQKHLKFLEQETRDRLKLEYGIQL